MTTIQFKEIKPYSSKIRTREHPSTIGMNSKNNPVYYSNLNLQPKIQFTANKKVKIKTDLLFVNQNLKKNQLNKYYY